MTEPGPTLKAPIKVVPIYFDVPATVPVDTVEHEGAAPAEPIEKSALLGTSAVVLAVAAGAAQATAIAMATGGDFSGATVLAYIAIVSAGIALIGGILAIVLNRGRRSGVVGAALAIFANPILLLGMLRLFGSLTT